MHLMGKKNGFLLIETFGRLFNPQIVGHLDHLRAVIDRGIQEALLSDTSKFNLMIFQTDCSYDLRARSL